MSVINQMLKDLDQRQTPNMNGIDMFRLLKVGPEFSARGNSFNFKLFLIIPVLIIVLFAVKNWNFNASNQSVEFSKFDPAKQVLTAENTASAIRQIEPEIVYLEQDEGVKTDNGLQLVKVDKVLVKEEENVFSIEIESLSSLQNLVQRSVLEGNMIHYRIEDAQLEVQAPELNFNNRYVKSLDIYQSDAAVIVDVVLNKNMVSEFMESVPDGDRNYRLSINIMPKPVNKNVEVKKAVSEKSVSEQEAIVVSTKNEPVFSEHDDKILSIKKPVQEKMDVKSKYNYAMNLLKSGRVEKAIVHFEQLLRSSPGHSLARIALSSIYLKSGRFMEAAIILNDGVVMDPLNADLALMYGRLLIERGELAQASHILKAAELSAQGNAEYLALTAAVLQRLKKHEEAVDYYVKALGVQANKSVWWIGMAISLEALEKNSEAVKAYQAAKNSGLSDAELMKYVNARLKHLNT